VVRLEQRRPNRNFSRILRVKHRSQPVIHWKVLRELADVASSDALEMVLGGVHLLVVSVFKRFAS
jgi:hypothetical protein